MTKSQIRKVVDDAINDWADELDHEQVRAICQDVANKLEKLSSDVIDDDTGFFDNIDAPVTSDE